MAQQINFFKDEFRKRTEYFTATQGLFLLIFVFCGVLLLVYEEKQVESTLAIEIKQAEQQAVLKKAELESLRKQYSVKDKGQELDTQLEKVNAAIAEKSKLQASLGVTLEEKFPGFSPYFIALARQHDPAVWLSEVSIEKNSMAIIMMGKSVSAAGVPAYLQRLSHEPVFSGVQFSEFKMIRDKKENKGRYIDFLITTIPNKRTLADAQVVSN